MPLSPSDTEEYNAPESGEDTGVATEESPTSDDVEGSSPKPTHLEVIQEELKASREKSAEESQGDGVNDPDMDVETPPDGTPPDESGKVKAEDQNKNEPDDEDPANIPGDELKALSERSRTRFQKLANERNVLNERVIDLLQYQQDVNATIKAANATPDQMTGMLEFVRLENSSNLDERKEALALALEKVKDLSIALGVKVPGVNILSDHKDLNERVELGEIDLSDAEEQAILREKVKYREENDRVMAEQKMSVQQEQAEMLKIASDINIQMGIWRQNDPDWIHKQAILAEKAKEIRVNYPKTQYLTVIKDLKSMLDRQFEMAKPKPDPKEKFPSASSASRDQNKKPTSHLEAIKQVLAGGRH